MDRLDRIENWLEAFEVGLEALRVSQANTDAQLAKTDAQLAKTDAKLWGLGLNIGLAAEEIFYDVLKENLVIGNVKFESIERNVKSSYKKTQDEFDIVLYNGDSIGIVEIKHKVHPNDLETLKNKKTENFRTLFPMYKDYKIYLALGGMSIPEEVQISAAESGIAILKPKGNVAQIISKNLVAY